MEYILLSTIESNVIGSATINDVFDTLTIHLKPQYYDLYKRVMLRCIEAIQWEGNFDILVSSDDTTLVVSGMTKNVWIAIRQVLFLHAAIVVSLKA